jgi:hypothetical protein
MRGMQTLNLACLRFKPVYHFDVARGAGNLAAIIIEARHLAFSGGTGRVPGPKTIVRPQIRSNEPARHMLGANHARSRLDGDG